MFCLSVLSSSRPPACARGNRHFSVSGAGSQNILCPVSAAVVDLHNFNQRENSDKSRNLESLQTMTDRTSRIACFVILWVKHPPGPQCFQLEFMWLYPVFCMEKKIRKICVAEWGVLGGFSPPARSAKTMHCTLAISLTLLQRSLLIILTSSILVIITSSPSWDHHHHEISKGIIISINILILIILAKYRRHHKTWTSVRCSKCHWNRHHHQFHWRTIIWGSSALTKDNYPPAMMGVPDPNDSFLKINWWL